MNPMGRGMWSVRPVECGNWIARKEMIIVATGGSIPMPPGVDAMRVVQCT